ncbi:cytochrome c-type biogenesis protein CcmH [Colwellia sp. BRX10-4]|nr:cytochrome c-type biogenesis protein [Colwellia sp. BRX10-4]MBA6398545.1 cytochrome c-type biogenesis protein CcmH [Colwellia sp. BRX10-4]
MFNKLLVAAFLTTVTLLSSFVLAGPVDTYVFKDKVTEIRFNALNKELRCPKCQNQNLADSNSPIAEDLRREVYDMLQQGKADMEIVDFMVSRYGEFVLYRPRVSSLTYLLWYGPAGLLFIGVIVVVIIIRRKPVKNAQQPLSNDQKNKLDQILKHK